MQTTKIGKLNRWSKRLYWVHCSAKGCAVKKLSRVDNLVKSDGKCAKCAAKAGSVVCNQKPECVVPMVK